MYINIYMIVGYALTIVSKLENHFNQRFSYNHILHDSISLEYK